MLAAILFLILLLTPRDEAPGTGTISIRFGSARAVADLEDREGTAQEDTTAAAWS